MKLSCSKNTSPGASVFIQGSTQYLEECAVEWKSSKDLVVSKLIIVIGMPPFIPYFIFDSDKWVYMGYIYMIMIDCSW